MTLLKLGSGAIRAVKSVVLRPTTLVPSDNWPFCRKYATASSQELLEPPSPPASTLPAVAPEPELVPLLSCLLTFFVPPKDPGAMPTMTPDDNELGRSVTVPEGRPDPKVKVGCVTMTGVMLPSGPTDSDVNVDARLELEAGGGTGVKVGEGVCPGRSEVELDSVVEAPAVGEEPALALLLLEGDTVVVDPLPRMGPTLLPPEDEGLTTVVVVSVVTMVVVMYVLEMKFVGPLLIATVSPFPNRFTICEADWMYWL